MKSISNNADYCEKSNIFALSVIKQQKPDIVIIAQNAGHDISNFREIASELKRECTSRILILGPVPHWTRPLYEIIASNYWRKTPNRISSNLSAETINENGIIRDKINSSEQFEYIDLLDFFCNKSGCLSYIGNNRKEGITTFDYGHLTPTTSNFLAKQLIVPLIMKQNT